MDILKKNAESKNGKISVAIKLMTDKSLWLSDCVHELQIVEVLNAKAIPVTSPKVQKQEIAKIFELWLRNKL